MLINSPKPAPFAPRVCRDFVFLVLATFSLFTAGTSRVQADEVASRGSKIYQARCAKCHGTTGEGTADHHPEPLIGDRSLQALFKYLPASMPPDTQEKVLGEDAKAVAAYIFHEFYSPEAQARQGAPKPGLNHLTTRQYRNAVADIMLSFRGWTGPIDDQRGLKASYNTTQPNGDGKHVMDRLDPEIKFDFGKSSPDPEKINPREFSIMWSGSIQAPVTGEYEFIIRSPNSVKLWVNDRVEPLIDAWVKSGDATEFRAVVRLLGGRRYPMSMNFTKSGQGVQKAAEQKAKEEIRSAAISLSWVPPGRSEQIVPKEFLFPHHYPESYVVATPFPPDDRSTGFERGSSVSKEWDQATTQSALEVAEYVVLRLRDLTGGAEPGPDYEKRLREFCRQFAERAFRRPLTDDQRALYIDRQFNGATDLETAVQKVVLMVLKSPRFLYHGVGSPQRDTYDVASRLSFALWDAPPDQPLLAAAAEGKLSNREEILRQAERMAADERFRFKLREFLLQWMKLDQVRELSKSTEQFAGFDVAVARDLRLSLELFLDDVIVSENCNFRQLFRSNRIYLNGRLAKLYGANLPPDSPFQKVEVDADRRAGILTHPYLMSVYADATTTSPIRRGVFLARSVLGRALLPPPDAFVPLAPSLHPNLNTRERAILQTKAESCQACHALINPLGFTLENFDAIGRWRGEELNRPVDATGNYAPRNGDAVKFNGARELANHLAQSEEAHSAFVEKLFHFAVQQPIRTYGADASSQVKKTFRDSQFNMRKMFIEVSIIAAQGPQQTTAQTTGSTAQ